MLKWAEISDTINWIRMQLKTNIIVHCSSLYLLDKDTVLKQTSCLII